MAGRWATRVCLGLLWSAPLGCGQSQLGDGVRAAGGMAGTASGAAGTVSGAAGMAAGSGGTAGMACEFWGFPDQDGDGFGDNEGWVCADSYAGDVSGLGGDCDDTDASVQWALYRDADGDGAGRLDELGCFAADADPPGYASTGLDCDDEDAAIGPQIVDLPGDGLDRDCDGLDAAVDCSLLGLCPCDRGPFEAPAAATCDGVDLAAVDFADCSNGCGGLRRYARIANYGTQAAAGPIEIFAEHGERVILLEGLAAGTVTEPFPVPFQTGAFSVRTSANDDCNPDNDRFTPPEPAGMRTFCIPK